MLLLKQVKLKLLLRADTETKEVFNKFYKDRRYQHSFMSQVVEQGREAVSKRLVTDRQAEQLEYMVEQGCLCY